MITRPNCKINLGLFVTSKRPDGYHNLESIFLPVPLTDELEIAPSDAFSFEQEGILIDGDSMQNLVVRAYQLLLADYPQSVGPVTIRLCKNIPFGAGLGGGSSDAAFAIKMLSELFSLGLSVEQMESYARLLGADCAFFIQNRPVYATGRGDEFEPIDVDLSAYNLVLLKPSCGVSTAEAYRGLTPHAGKADLRKAIRQPIDSWRQVVENHFEESIFAKCPEIAHLKQELYRLGALYASMSGSGSTVFGLFSKGQVPSFDHLPADVLRYVL